MNFNSFDNDLELVLERARDNGISRILVPGVNLDSSQKAVELADKHPEIYAAIGVHPNSADTWNERSLEQLAQLRKHPKVVAVGEIGLDFYREHTTPERQQEVLISQLEFARTQQLPVILHSRQAVTPLLQILERFYNNVKMGELAIFHSFTGTLEEALAIIENGYVIGVGGQITYTNNQEARDILSQLPVDSIILETDAPYLSPHPLRGKRNEPANVLLTANVVSEVMNVKMQELSKKTTGTAESLFHWSTIGE